MTNGEKIKEIFPNIDTSIVGSGDVIDVYNLGMYCQTFDVKWWNAEYKEPTTKNEAKYCDRNICLKSEVYNVYSN